jgi:hypothetical protein
MLVRIASGHDGCAGRLAERTLAVSTREAYPLGCHAIQIGRVDSRVAEAVQRIVAMLVRHEKQDIRTVRRSGSQRTRGRGSPQKRPSRDLSESHVSDIISEFTLRYSVRS